MPDLSKVLHNDEDESDDILASISPALNCGSAGGQFWYAPVSLQDGHCDGNTGDEDDQCMCQGFAGRGGVGRGIPVTRVSEGFVGLVNLILN